MLKKIKKQVIPLREYTNFLHFPYEILDKTDKKIYKQLCQEYDVLKYTCCYLSKGDLLDENYTNMHF